ncbi:MAG: hypothetical protein ETSY1_20955 [Candidatus Entotheonella factor]|uniref:Uncharacterized protein n=1 Tax=Entotheonella factor TaxID=1429438 RepID=W4LIZ8_ENTF1|nr:hypothetical protein [Candidatus Entotheonella palauensis]ETW97874.1 MAG: hypothetical protein ETSY1_20955 [Candidatus Entotheonella factor]
MIAEHPATDYQFFQYRHHDFVKEAEKQRLLNRCRRQHGAASAQRRLMTRLGSALDALCGVFSKRDSQPARPEAPLSHVSTGLTS